MLHFTRLALATAGLALTACAASTPYQANIAPGQWNGTGFSETKTADNRYEVHYTGNTTTDQDTVENYFLYRSAELTDKAGFDFFVITKPVLDAQYRRPCYGDNYSSTTYSSCIKKPRTPDSDGVVRYTAKAQITMFMGTKPADNDNAYEAKAVLEDLGTKIKLTRAGT